MIRKKVKFLLSGILAAVLVVTAFPLSARAEEESTESGETSTEISYEALMSEAKDHWSFDTLASDTGSLTEGVLNGEHIEIADSGIPLFGNVLRFGEGSGSYMRLENYINTGEGNTSFSLWYKCDKQTLDDTVVLLQHEDPGRIILSLETSYKYQTFLNGTKAASNADVLLGEWQHITVVFNQTDRKVYYYVNGNPVEEAALGSDYKGGNLTLRLGAHKSGGNQMHGDIDEFCVFDRALTAEEAKVLYEEKGKLLNATTPILETKDHWSFDTDTLDSSNNKIASDMGIGTSGTLVGSNV